MFTYVRLKNFKSFDEVTFDFRKKKDPKSYNDVKRLIAVYGENGSGKSNLVEGIAFLGLSVFNFTDRNRYQEMMHRITDEDSDLKAAVRKAIVSQLSMAENFFTKYRTIHCDEPTEIEYGLLMDGKEWKYTLKFTDRLLEECLYGMRKEIRGVIFHITYCENGTIQKSFWNELFINDKFREDLEDEIDKYWGKYSFLSLFVSQSNTLNKEYVRKSIRGRLYQFIRHALNMRVGIRVKEGISDIGRQYHVLLDDLESGKIDEDEMPILKTTQKILKSFFAQTYADIKDVYYRTEPAENNQIKYTLYLDKMIAGSIRTLPFKWESDGTKSLLEKIRYIINAFLGTTSVCDEIDNGIHDLLIESILTSAKNELETLSENADNSFTGQLIITTHNTLLLESLKPADIYVIDVDYLGRKEAVCLEEFPIQKTDNKRLKYLKGLFGGVPMADSIDFDTIVEYGKSEKTNADAEDPS